MPHWLRAAALLPPRRLPLLRRASSSLRQPRDLRTVPAAQQWLQALGKAPCLVCGGDKYNPSSVVRAFPLTCSPECQRMAATERTDELRVFQQVHEDLTYTASDEAKMLLTQVLTRDRRRQQLNESNPHATSWEEFLHQFTRDARWLQDPCAVRLASAAYTFVATVSSLLPVLHVDEAHTAQQFELRVLGARAEAIMPRQIWEELVDAYPNRSFEIKLIGDHVVQYP